MATGDFKIRDGKLLMIRLGPMNGQVQRHRNENSAPARRGVWAFPYPFHDEFFYCHVWRKFLPKGLTLPVLPDESSDTYEGEMVRYREQMDEFNWEAHYKKLREIKKAHPPKKFWYGGGLYSPIKPHDHYMDQPWYWYDDPRAYMEVARKHIFANYSTRYKFSHDHFQVFIPC